LDLDVHVTFDTSTSGHITVNALTYRLAQGLQVAEGKDWVDFPESQQDWLKLLAASPGTSLTSWSGAEEDAGFRSSAVVAFLSIDALKQAFAAFKQKLNLTPDKNGKWTLTFSPQVPRLTGGDPQSRKLWTTLWGTRTWTFGFQPPGQKEIVKTITMAELASTRPPPDWTITW